MSKQFYSYLAQKVQNYFREKQVQRGDKFSIQFEEEVQVKGLYESIAETCEIFIYTDEKSGEVIYQTHQLLIGDVAVIIAATLNGIQDAFLTRLRNMVSDGIGQFENTAILFIHNTSLDSLMNGAESFQKEGMPFHVNQIVKAIEATIEKSALNETDQTILKFALEKKEAEVFIDNTSVFEYEQILEVLANKKMKRENYSEFGLFFDEDLMQGNEKDIQTRLNKNYELFGKVDSIHKYGNPDRDLERDFDDKGIDLLKEKNWSNVAFIDVLESTARKKNTTPIAYRNCESKEKVELWDRAEGTSKVKERIRNIIAFNKDHLDSVTLELGFDDYVKESCKKGNAICSGKKLVVTIENTNKDEAVFERIIYEQDVKFDFRIAVVACDSVILEKMKTNYTIGIKNRESYIEYNLEEELILNPQGIEENEIVLQEDNNEGFLSANEKLRIRKAEELAISCEDNEHIKIKVRGEHYSFPLVLKEEFMQSIPITGMRVWKEKRLNRESFFYDKGKLIQGTQEFFAREDFRINLEREEKLLNSQGVCHEEDNDGILREIDVDVDEQLMQAYVTLIECFKRKKVLPSAAFYDQEIKDCSNAYVKTFLNHVKAIAAGDYVSGKSKELLRIGTIEKRSGDEEILLTPLHPLVVAYQLLLNEKINDESIPDELLIKLNPTYLVPYFYNLQRELYEPIEQVHSLEWLYYVKSSLPRYKGSRNFVSKLVQEKIQEFLEHFSYLFSLTKQAALKINLVNLGDCKEVMQGILNYYIDILKKKPLVDQLIPIEIYLYSDPDAYNVFEEAAYCADPETISEKYDVKLSLGKEGFFSEADIIKIFREKVSFSQRKLTDRDYEYAHISFYEMNQNESITTSKMSDLTTGVALDGLLSGVPSVYLDDDSYRTGFGTKNLVAENSLIEVAKALNALAVALKASEPYDPDRCITSVIFSGNKAELEKVYDRSHWVTFIEPKVDLNFFKNDLELRDLMIIHYSDQYTSSSGYDAITVTKKSVQYQTVIEEFLKGKAVNNVELYSPQIINFFNAINGDWLLRLLSKKSQFPREKISILSGVKHSLAVFNHPEIIWIPVSMEEVLRVSGGAGLTKSEGLFSVKNLGVKGAFSDDFLLVGIQQVDEDVKIYYYPVEVKIGINNSNVKEKAAEQALKTKKLLRDNLTGKEYKAALYRNFLIQIALVSAEKMRLYHVWPEQNWDSILSGPIREKLTRDEYQISDGLKSLIGDGAVISFTKDRYHREYKFQEADGLVVIDLPEERGYQDLTANTEELKNKYVEGQTDIDPTKLLYTLLKNQKMDTTPKAEVSKEYKIEVQTEMVSRVAEEKTCSEMRIVFGEGVETEKPIYWYPTNTNKTTHTNTGIIGTMGTGKTQFTKSLIAQLHRNQSQNVDGENIGILIFDYKGDYIDEEFKKETAATVYDPYQLPYNPLALALSTSPRPLLPLHTANMLKETISRAFRLGPKQETTLRDLIMEAYEKRGIRKADSSTWANMAPTLNDLFTLYFDREDLKEDVMYAALKQLSEFEVFERDPYKTKSLMDLLHGVTVINLSGYDESIQNLVVAITLDVFYTQMLIGGESKIREEFRQLTKMILVDEADNFLSKNFNSLKKILKEGRMFGVGTILSTQLLSHFSTGENDYANYISTWVVHNVADLNAKDVRYIFNTEGKAAEDSIYSMIKQLKKHYSLVKLPNENKPLYCKDKAFWQLIGL